jgi:hypothetical protein
LAHTTKYRDGATFRGATRLPELEETTIWSDTQILGLAVAAEDFLRGFGEPEIVTTKSQLAFDAACREYMLMQIAEPSGASSTTTGDTNLIFKKNPAIDNWVKFAENGGRSGFVSSRAERACR